MATGTSRIAMSVRIAIAAVLREKVAWSMQL